MDVLDFATIPLREYLPEAVYTTALERAHRVKYEDGQALHARGDQPGRLRIVASGAVRFGRFTPDGSFNLLTMLGPGAHYGDLPAFLGATRVNNAYAVGPTEIDVFDQRVLDDLLINQPSFARGLSNANAARLIGMMELYDDVRTLTVEERLAKVLWYHTGRGEHHDGVACLQRDLSELLGVSQVAIGKALKHLARAGLVEPGYRCVRIPDKGRLEQWLKDAGAV